MSTEVLCFIYMLLVSDIGVWTNSIKLIPNEIIATENSSASLTCSKTNGILAGSVWFYSKLDSWASLFNLNDQCITKHFLNNSALFRGVCNDDGTFSVIINKIHRSQHEAEWICSEYSLTNSNKVAIKVLVPATSVTLSQYKEAYMKENQAINISCSTSACRPNPTVQWYLRNSYDLIVYNLTQFSTNKYINGGYGLKSVESILTLSPNRTINNFLLYCEVWTRSDIADKTSRENIVNVTYPPDKPPVIHGVESNDAIQVIESDKGTFVCSITGGNPIASLSWNCFYSHNSTSRTQDSTVTSTVKWTALRSYSTCSCTSNHVLSNWKRTANVTVNVQYPPTKPHFKIGQTSVIGDVRVIQNNTLRVICNSESNPLSNYTWTGPDISGKGDTLEITSVNIGNQGNYKCVASNRMIRTNGSYEDGSHTSSFNLTILYPPSDPKFKFENSSGPLIQLNIFNVVRNDTFSIYCDAKGNPAPDIKWDDNKSNPKLSISNIDLDINSTCRATNLMKETASQTEVNSKSEESFSIIAFYPPGLPTILISNYNGDSVQVTNGNVSVIESETINMTCFSTSKPMPTYKWIYEQYMNTKSTNVLKFFNISRHESGTYACNVENIMKRSIGKTEVGKNKSQIKLNILYPAIVNNIHDASIVEGSQLETLCPVVDGNPSNSTVTWSRQSDENQWNNRLLFIKNVLRADDENYTCSVITEMHPTIGRSSKIERRKSFHLNVFFPSEINTFTISTVSSGRTFVVNRTQNPSFECIAEANPTSDLTIMSPWGDYIVEVSKSNIARHTLHNASFKDAGEYICTGRNNYTRGSPSQSKLILIVKSRPRPSSGETNVIKVATILNVDVTLIFTAWNYLDEPNKTMFSWFKENVAIPNNDNKYMIHSNDFQTDITIMNTTQQDYGHYKVNVENSVGLYTNYYELKATDKPEIPRDFRVINNSITDTSVTLAWSPGFNGGLQQTFVIIYTIKHDSLWLNKSIQDKGDTNMNYTLNDLLSMQEYEMEMFAKNIEGNSIHTERLYFKTKGIQKSNETETMGSSNTGAFVGAGVGASVVTLALVAGSFFGYKRLKNIRSLRRRESPKPGVTAGSHELSTYTDLDASRRELNNYDEFNVQYEHLNTSSRDPNSYMELKNTNIPNTDTSDYVNIRI